MDLAFLNTLTHAQRTALAILAEDLQNFGVTDSMGTNPVGLKNMVKTADIKPAPAQPIKKPEQPTPRPPSSTTAYTLGAKPSAKPFVLEEHLRIIKGTLPFTVILSAPDGENLWADAEETLWHNMLKAMGFEGQSPSFQLLVGEAAHDAPLAVNHEASLRKAMLEKLAPQPILVMGHRALQILSAGEGHAAAVRRKEWQLKMPEKPASEQASAQKNSPKACFLALVATYHVHTLLRQPFLKRQTWADLLNLKQMLEEGQE